MADLAPDDEIQADGFTKRQRRFVEEYCVDCNSAAAARRAGYSEEYAKEIGYQNYTKLHIRQAIDARLAVLALPAAETTKRLSEIATSNLQNFLVVEKRTRKTVIQVPLQQLIDAKAKAIAFADRYASKAGLSKKEMKQHTGEQVARRREVIKLELELEDNPEATGSWPGPDEEYEIATLDLVKLSKAEEGGIIKKLSPGEFGYTVELFPADAALDKLARMHGLYEKDNKQLSGTEVIIIGGGSGEEAA